MRTFAITLAAGVAALGLAAPAAAQYSPQPAYGYGYAQPTYGYGYAQPYQARYNSWLYNFRDTRYTRMMQDRVQRIRYDIRQMAAMRVLSRGEARSLDSQARNLQDRIYRYTRYGVSPGEARSLDRQVRRLEERVVREAHDWNRRPHARRYNPWNYNQYWNQYGNYR